MKHFIWMLCGIFLSGLLLGSLSACSSTRGETFSPPPGQAADPDPAAGTNSISEDAQSAYAALLRQLRETQTLPDGTELECLRDGDVIDMVSLEMNDFAVYDVDGDGRAELILNWVNTGVANMTELVYGYDAATGTVREELREFPGVVFYDNGAAEAPWSHNQGNAGDKLWPFNVYQYSPDSDTYTMMGAADAWDGSYREADSFPGDVDADGDGVVYFLLSADGSQWSDGYASPVDGPDYENWRSFYFGEGRPLEFPWLTLTEENINRLEGTPLPQSRDDGPTPDPESSPSPNRENGPSVEPAPLQPSEEDSLPHGRPVDFDRIGLPAAYAAAMEQYCRDGTFPDGQAGGEIPSRIAYAVCDVDGDGQDELILQNTDTYVAGMTERVFAYDESTKTFREEFGGFPTLTYYDNGVIQADWSHNQGRAGDKLWPYTLYQYQPEEDRYEPLGSVDAWDRSLGGHMDAFGGDFPEETDADGDGYLYFLLPANWQGEYTRGSLVDGPDYENWRNHYLSEARILEIPYQAVEVETVFPNAAG